MAEEKELSAEEQLKKATWGYIGVGVLWFSLFITGVAVERLGLTEDIPLGPVTGEVKTLRETNAALERDLDKVKDDKQRLQGLVGREQACQDAKDNIQSDKEACLAELKELKASMAAPEASEEAAS